MHVLVPARLRVFNSLEHNKVVVLIIDNWNDVLYIFRDFDRLYSNTYSK